jgi:hypothetical protein
MSLLDRFNLKSKKMALDVTEVVGSIPAELFTTTEDAEMQTDEAQAQLVADLAVANDTIAELTSAVANHEAAATKALAQEVAKRNITVNAVAPGFIRTDMTSELDEKELLKLIPVNRFGEAEEVADLVSFLISKKASYITGEIININGGIYS